MFGPLPEAAITNLWPAGRNRFETIEEFKSTLLFHAFGGPLDDFLAKFPHGLSVVLAKFIALELVCNLRVFHEHMHKPLGELLSATNLLLVESYLSPPPFKVYFKVLPSLENYSESELVESECEDMFRFGTFLLKLLNPSGKDQRTDIPDHIQELIARCCSPNLADRPTAPLALLILEIRQLYWPFFRDYKPSEEFTELFEKYGLSDEQRFPDGIIEMQKSALLNKSPLECILIGELFQTNEGYSTAAYMFRLAGDHPMALRNLGAMHRDGVGVKQDFKKAVECFTKAADLGDIPSVGDLGVMYLNGRGVEVDIVKALSLFRLAASAGLKSSRCNLALVLLKGGGGVERDEVQAISMLHELADEGDGDAQILLGRIYQNGLKGMREIKDSKKALEFFELAAANGKAQALFLIGLMHHRGEGTHQDFYKVIRFYEMAAEKGDVEASIALGVCYWKGEGIPEDFEKAAHLFKQAADKGNSLAIFHLGVMAMTGEGMEMNEVEGAKMVSTAASMGCALAQFALAMLHLEGKGVEQDVDKAVHFLEEAGNRGHLGAMVELGVMFQRGDLVPLDARRAIFWYEKAADLGDAESLCNLGTIYSRGDGGVPIDPEKAFNFFKRAALHGHAVSLYNLGVSYERGAGVSRDERKAAELFHLAALQNFSQAKFNLGSLYEEGKGVANDWAKAVAWKKV